MPREFLRGATKSFSNPSPARVSLIVIYALEIRAELTTPTTAISCRNRFTEGPTRRIRLICLVNVRGAARFAYEKRPGSPPTVNFGIRVRIAVDLSEGKARTGRARTLASRSARAKRFVLPRTLYVRRSVTRGGDRWIASRISVFARRCRVD